jgi:hypothetical protein
MWHQSNSGSGLAPETLQAAVEGEAVAVNPDSKSTFAYQEWMAYVVVEHVIAFDNVIQNCQPAIQTSTRNAQRMTTILNTLWLPQP